MTAPNFTFPFISIARHSRDLLAHALTPWVIFVSPALSLYLINQEDFNFDPEVLTPFLGVALFGALLSYGILWDSQRNNHYRIVPWLVFLAGPAFVLGNTLSGMLPQALGWPVYCATWLVVIAAAYSLRNVNVRRVMPFLAFFAVLVIFADALQFYLAPELPEKGNLAATEGKKSHSVPISSDRGSRGNIYHIVLDGYQSDIFGLLLDDELKSNLGGFSWYKRNSALFGKTRLSLAAVFSGRLSAPDQTFWEIRNSAFSSPNSLLALVNTAGYRTSAYLHADLDFSPNLFQEVFYHQQFAKRHSWSSRSLMWLWLYRYWPKSFSDHLLGSGITGRIEAGSLAPEGYPVVSLDTFEEFLRLEKSEAGSNRYIFLHLIIPHPPYLVDEHCQPGWGSAPVSQYLCANRIIAKLIKELKALNRFDDSMIVIHADHGDDFRIQGNRLIEIRADRMSAEYHTPRSKALLLLKPFGAGENNSLAINETRTTLLDIAPTFAEALGLSGESAFEGVSLLDHEREDRQRYYYVDDGTAFHRFAVHDDSLRFDQIIELK